MVCQTHPYLGFDINSFAYDGTPSCRSWIVNGKLTRFHFSNNEMQVAEKSGDAYRIVCVSNVLETPSFLEIRNPISN